ncbi:polysaccharide pyruvyl transferase family protein [Aliivibrio sp. 1S128]|uniref:polysaccharide pyruvyl transferase family protein n=1 Tax=Aliivibrio sp. 1S128 TaxID=1840085 RepID=UPI00080E6C52|nr:polysaccharide pyruvyl transferase family protein [Aliivibrio sp. 1S128]OCH25477.1 hypothetical protein A6E03_01380 [Aliivibrio sp. 1S128]
MSKKLNKKIKKYALNKYFLKETDPNLIGIYDTSYGSLNVGDEIINQATRKVITELFDKHQHLTASTHDGTSSFGIYNFNRCLHRFVCGSNIFSRNMLHSNQWNINLIDTLRMKEIISLGVGWGRYEKKDISPMTKWFYRHLLDSNTLHSVRDNFTKQKLNDIGINNVINTGCPTMWELTEEHCNQIPTSKAKNVAVTLTDYRKDIDSDTFLLNTLSENYDNVYLWLQGDGDAKYITSLQLKLPNLTTLPARLSAYEKLLMSDDMDFVGTRLHAGIKALQNKKRSIIIGVDNRAIEKQKDFNLTVISRDKLKEQLADKINSNFSTDIKIATDNIREWKAQFK